MSEYISVILDLLTCREGRKVPGISLIERVFAPAAKSFQRRENRSTGWVLLLLFLPIKKSKKKIQMGEEKIAWAVPPFSAGELDVSPFLLRIMDKAFIKAQKAL